MVNNIENMISLLKTVNMHHAAENLHSIIEKSIETSQTREKFLEEILLKEISCREKRKLDKRLKYACFPEYKTLDSFNLDEQASISKNQFNQLKELSWLDNGFNIIFLGPPGVGNYRKYLVIERNLFIVV